MFVVIVHFKFLLILNNDVNDICIVYAIPEKSTQLIEYYWDCIPVIGLRPESVHTRNGLGANSYAKVYYSLVWQNPTLHRNDLWRPFRSSANSHFDVLSLDVMMLKDDVGLWSVAERLHVLPGYSDEVLIGELLFGMGIEWAVKDEVLRATFWGDERQHMDKTSSRV